MALFRVVYPPRRRFCDTRPGFNNAGLSGDGRNYHAKSGCISQINIFSPVGKFSKYKVQLASLADGRYEQDFVCDTDFFRNMENTEVVDADIAVHLDLEKKNEAYHLHFTCKGMMHIPCDRCLDPMEHDVDTTYDLTVKYGEEYDDAADDLLVIPYSDAYLNVAYMLYDTIMLTIPLRHVHAPGQCNRAMAAVLHKHHAGEPDDPETAEDLDDPADD